MSSLCWLLLSSVGSGSGDGDSRSSSGGRLHSSVFRRGRLGLGTGGDRRRSHRREKGVAQNVSRADLISTPQGREITHVIFRSFQIKQTNVRLFNLIRRIFEDVQELHPSILCFLTTSSRTNGFDIYMLHHTRWWQLSSLVCP